MYNDECQIVQIFEHLTLIFKQITHPIGLLFCDNYPIRRIYLG
jgi:hypothetical protein